MAIVPELVALEWADRKTRLETAARRWAGAMGAKCEPPTGVSGNVAQSRVAQLAPSQELMSALARLAPETARQNEAAREHETHVYGAAREKMRRQIRLIGRRALASTVETSCAAPSIWVAHGRRRSGVSTMGADARDTIRPGLRTGTFDAAHAVAAKRRSARCHGKFPHDGTQA